MRCAAHDGCWVCTDVMSSLGVTCSAVELERVFCFLVTTGGRQVKLRGVTEALDVVRMPQHEGPELRLELRQLGSGISIMYV